MSTSFRPSEFDKQATASLDMIDEQAAAERVQKILHPEAVNSGGIAKVLKEAQAGPTLAPAPQTQPASPIGRKKRSDAGIPKGPKKPAVERKGFLTVEQVAHLSKLIEASVQADNEAVAAQGRALNASVDLHSYLDELTIDSPGRSK